MRTNSDAYPKWPSALANRGIGMIAAAMIVLVGIYFASTAGAEASVKIPSPETDVAAGTHDKPETAVFAGGCFWGVQAVFQHTRGVLNAISGYAGGAKETASYPQVSTGDTGHAESVQVTFDPRQISYGKLLQIYFSVAHDPTQLNRQYPDSGTQYRSVIFYKDAQQKRVAEQYIAQLNKAHVFPSRIVTQLNPFTAFYPAEAYHQDYATRHPDSPYIAMFDLPKIDDLKNMFPGLYRQAPVLVASQRTATENHQE